jgi:hypothetical protein
MPLPAHIRVVIGSGGNVSARSGRQIEGGIGIFAGAPVQGDTLTLESNIWSSLGENRTTGVSSTSAVTTLSAAPNPFREQTSIVSHVSVGTTLVTIYNLFGETVRRLTASDQRDGAATHVWDGCDDAGREVPSGIYLCIVATNSTGSSMPSSARLLLHRIR